MIFEFTDILPALPEIFVLGMTCLVLLAGLFTPANKSDNVVYILAQITLIGAALLSYRTYPILPQYAFNHMFILDSVAGLAKLFIYGISFFTFLYARKYIKVHAVATLEFYVLGLLAVLGMMVMASAHNLLPIFLGLELLSLPLYTMVAMRRGIGNAAESAMKYFVMGALASGMLLYGLSLLYGATKSLDVTVIAEVTNRLPAGNNLILIFGLVFIVAGLAFKFGAAPFHMWAPDVYEGAPNVVTLFIGSAPKIAILLLTFRLLLDAMPSLNLQWQQLLILISILSMAFGNIVAIVQTNLKRMLAYSAIAHMGYMLLGLLTATAQGYAASLFYMIAYTIMTAGAFATLVIMSAAGFEAEQVDDLRGLNNRNPWLAFMMLLVMFSMAGIPPTVGFFAKLGVLEALIGVGMVWLAVLALIFAIIGAYYYLRVVKAMYFEAQESVVPIAIGTDVRIAVSINGLLMLGLGMFPSGLIQACRSALGA